jgi:hypothetical protein
MHPTRSTAVGATPFPTTFAMEVQMLGWTLFHCIYCYFIHCSACMLDGAHIPPYTGRFFGYGSPWSGFIIIIIIVLINLARKFSLVAPFLLFSHTSPPDLVRNAW